eukprot:TRINITY_DN329_c0_g1_i2.p2 TRINITY_DN329_c0_g1~~TRINITY_DN329_c0_g1_i2.p2  ORF type:complete len:152 (-),score=36.69 TRINITY_DN329_c0_g1_i2:30-485(-)
MKQENSNLREVITSCNKVLHVNNLTEEEDPELAARKECGSRIRLHLRNCRDVYRPHELDQLNDRIGSYMSEKEKLQQQLDEINSKLAQKEKATEEMIKQWNKEKELSEQRIQSLKDIVSKETGKQIQEKNPGIFTIIGGLADKFIKKCVIQ